MSYFNLHLILQIILYNCLYIELSSFLPFPMHQFFNESIDNKILSKYVCSYNPVETKYCSCSKYSFMNNNWCIDVFWMDKDDFTLDTYLEYLKKKYLSMLAKNGFLTCEPVIYPVKRNHLVERMLMHSTYVVGNNIRKRCVDETFRYSALSISVADETRSNIYTNEFCAFANNVKNIKRFKLLALCVNIEKVKVNMPLNLTAVEELDKCEFSFIPVSQLNFMQCAREENGCAEDDPDNILCNAYLAPTNGYRNRHCYLCANGRSTRGNQSKSHNMINETVIEVNECRRDSKSVCLLGYKYEFSNKNAIHIDYADETKELRIARLEYVFPAQKFFKDYKHGFHPQTKLRDDVCCFNKDSCWKFKSCCANKLWDSSRSMDLDLYKELLINSSAPYKDHHCELLVPNSGSRQRMGYFMITTCLSNATE